jgi:hypothetical protein
VPAPGTLEVEAPMTKAIVADDVRFAWPDGEASAGEAVLPGPVPGVLGGLARGTRPAPMPPSSRRAPSGTGSAIRTCWRWPG